LNSRKQNNWGDSELPKQIQDDDFSDIVGTEVVDDDFSDVVDAGQPPLSIMQTESQGFFVPETQAVTAVAESPFAGIQRQINTVSGRVSARVSKLKQLEKQLEGMKPKTVDPQTGAWIFDTQDELQKFQQLYNQYKQEYDAYKSEAEQAKSEIGSLVNKAKALESDPEVANLIKKINEQRAAENKRLEQERQWEIISQQPSIREGGAEQTLKGKNAIDLLLATGGLERSDIKRLGKYLSTSPEIPGAIARGAVEGIAVEIPRMVGQAAEYLGTRVGQVSPPISAVGTIGGKKIQEFANTAQEALFSESPEYSGIAKHVYEGSKMLAPSILPAGIAGGVARATLAGVKSLNALQKAQIAARIAGLTSGALFGASQAQSVIQSAKERGVDPGTAPEIEGAIEALGEYVGTRYLAKLLGLDENALKVTLRNFIKSLGVENTTEFLQQLGQSATDIAYGIRKGTLSDALDDAIQVIGPTTFMTVMTGGVGKGAEKLAPVVEKAIQNIKRKEAQGIELNQAERNIKRQHPEIFAEDNFSDVVTEGRAGLPGTTGREFANVAVESPQKPPESIQRGDLSQSEIPPVQQKPIQEEIPARKLTEEETDAGLRQVTPELTREEKRALVDAGFTVQEVNEMKPEEAKAILGTERTTQERVTGEAREVGGAGKPTEPITKFNKYVEEEKDDWMNWGVKWKDSDFEDGAIKPEIFESEARKRVADDILRDFRDKEEALEALKDLKENKSSFWNASGREVDAQTLEEAINEKYGSPTPEGAGEPVVKPTKQPSRITTLKVEKPVYPYEENYAPTKRKSVGHALANLEGGEYVERGYKVTVYNENLFKVNDGGKEYYSVTQEIRRDNQNRIAKEGQFFVEDRALANKLVDIKNKNPKNVEDPLYDIYEKFKEYTNEKEYRSLKSRDKDLNEFLDKVYAPEGAVKGTGEPTEKALTPEQAREQGYRRVPAGYVPKEGEEVVDLRNERGEYFGKAVRSSVKPTVTNLMADDDGSVSAARRILERVRKNGDEILQEYWEREAKHREELAKKYDFPETKQVANPVTDESVARQAVEHYLVDRAKQKLRQLYGYSENLYQPDLWRKHGISEYSKNKVGAARRILGSNTLDELIEKEQRATKPTTEGVGERTTLGGESTKPVTAKRFFDSFKETDAPYHIEERINRAGFTYEKKVYDDYGEPYTFRSDETGRLVRWGVELSDGRRVSMEGFLRITKPDVYKRIKNKIHSYNMSRILWDNLSKDEREDAVRLVAESVAEIAATGESSDSIEKRVRKFLNEQSHPMKDSPDFVHHVVSKIERAIDLAEHPQTSKDEANAHFARRVGGYAVDRRVGAQLFAAANKDAFFMVNKGGGIIRVSPSHDGAERIAQLEKLGFRKEPTSETTKAEEREPTPEGVKSGAEERLTETAEERRGPASASEDEEARQKQLEEEKASGVESLKPTTTITTRTGGWLGNRVEDGRFIADGFILLDSNAIPANVKNSLLRKEHEYGKNVKQEKAGDIFEIYTKNLGDEARLLGFKEPEESKTVKELAYFADSNNNVVAFDALKLKQLEYATKYDNLRFSNAKGTPIVAMKNGKPVGVLMPRRVEGADVVKIKEAGEEAKTELPSGIGNPEKAEKFRQLAEQMQAQIDELRRPLTQNPTPKRMAQYRERIIEADDLERAQQALRVLADAHENRNVPPILADIKSKAEVIPLVRKGLAPGGGYYDRIPSFDYKDTSPKGKALQALIETKPEVKVAEVEKQKKQKIAQLEAEVQFRPIPGFFPTPKPLVQKMIEAADIEKGQKILEPSAGKGDILDVLKEEHPEITDVKAVEKVYTLANILKEKGYNTAVQDFMEYNEPADRILMNPPFEHGQDIDHVRHAYDLLNPGGRLVAIMSEGSFTRSGKKEVAFREWLDKVGGTSEKIGSGAFTGAEAFRQTGVASRMVVIDKPTDVLRQLTEEHTSSENFKRWFNGSKVVDENGKPKMVFSGHQNVEIYGSQYDPKRGTAGAFYATESPEIASAYALGKFGAKEHFENGEQYRIQAKNGKFTKKLWQIQLTDEQKKKWDEFAQELNEYGEPKHSGAYHYLQWARDNKDYDPLARRILADPYNLHNFWRFNEEMGYNIAEPAQGDEPYFMRQRKNETEEMMDALGIRWQSYEWSQPGVLAVFMSIKNPIDTSKPFPKDVLAALEQAAKGTRRLSEQEIMDRHWTGDYPLRNWVEDIKKQEETGEETYWTTQVPRKAIPILKRFGYDGIKDVGGKARQNPHTVWVAFGPQQIKSAIGNNGQFDPTNADMLKKIREQESVIQQRRIEDTLSNLSPETRQNVIVTTRANAPEALRQSISSTTKGIFHNGKVYLFENADERTLLHELAGHYNLYQLFGDKLNPFLDKLWADREAAIKNASWYNRYVREDPTNYNPDTERGRRNLANEYVAHLAEYQDRTTWEKLIAWLRSALRSIAPNLKWTDAELKKLIADGYREMQKRKGWQIPSGAPIFQAPLFQLGSRKFVATAIKVGDNLYRGNSGEMHADIVMRMTEDPKAASDLETYLTSPRSNREFDGFLDERGEFVSREEASRIAKQELASTDILRQIEGGADTEILSRVRPIIESTGGYNVRVDSSLGKPIVYFEHKGVKDAEGNSIPTTFARLPEEVDTPEKINKIVEQKNEEYGLLRQLDEGIEPTDDVLSPQAQENYERMKKNLNSVKVRLLEILQDNWVRVDKLIQQEGIVTESNPYVAKVLYAGRVQDRMDKIQKELDDIDKDVLKTAKATNIDDATLWRDVHTYLHAVHAPERNAVHGERASGLSDAEANALLEELRAKPEFGEIQRIAKRLAELNRRGLDILLDGGLISEERYRQLRELYPNHVPLNRIMDDTGIEQYIAGGEGFNVYSSGLKRAKGSEREVADIAANIATNLSTFTIRAEKNLVDLATLKFARDNKDLGLFEEIKPKAVGKRWDGSIIFQEIHDPLVLRLYEDGKPVYLRIKDANLARAFQNINIEKLSLLDHYANIIGRFYASLATRYSPGFGPGNKIRDLQELIPTIAATKELGVKGAFKAIKRDVLFQNIRAVTEYLMGKDTEGARLYAQMKADGGTTGGLALSTRKDIEINLEKLKKLNRSNPRKALQYIVETVDNINQIFEDSTRLSVYRTALEAGLTRQQAAFHAKNSTIDFNRKGTAGGIINAWWIFANASIQGSVKMLRAMKNPKVAVGTVLSVGTAVFLVSLWNDAIDKDWRDKVSKWDKLNGLPILVPSSDGIRYFTLPVSWALKPIKVIADRVIELASVGATDVKEAISDMLTSIIDGYNPLGGTDVVSALTPTVLDLPVDLARNRSWTGGMIHPEYGKKPKYTVYFKSLEKSPLGRGAIATAKALDDIGIEVSPADIKYTVDNMIGGTGRFVSQMISTAASAASGELPRAREIPFVSRFYRDIPSEEMSRFRSDLRAISEQETKVARLKVKALETGNMFDVETYQRAEAKLKDMREKSPAYQSLLKERREKKKAEDIRLGKKPKPKPDEYERMLEFEYEK
jgi:hypothetical protein